MGYNAQLSNPGLTWHLALCKLLLVNTALGLVIEYLHSKDGKTPGKQINSSKFDMLLMNENRWWKVCTLTISSKSPKAYLRMSIVSICS